MNAKTKPNPNETCESINLGIDAHAKWYYVGRIPGHRPLQLDYLDYSTPSNPGRCAVKERRG